MKTPAQRSEIAEDVLEKLHELHLHAQTPQIAGIVWRRMLNEDHRRRLGGNFEKAYDPCRTVKMWRKLFDVSPARAVIDISLGVDLISPETYRWLLREIGEAEGDLNASVHNAIATSPLAVLQVPCLIYWKGEELELEERVKKAPFEYFWKLARAAKHRGTISCSDFGPDTQSRNLADWKSRLGNSRGFPVELVDLIDTGRGEHHLKWPPEKMRVFEHVPGKGLREVTH